MNDPDIADTMGYLPAQSLESQLAWFDRLVTDQSRYIFAICRTDDNEHIGNVGLGRIDYVHRNAMLNIFLADPASRGKGAGSESTRLALAFAFERLNLHKVYLRTSARFVGAIRMYEKLGFVREGVMREHYFTQGGFEDKIIYSILSREFQNHQ